MVNLSGTEEQKKKELETCQYADAVKLVLLKLGIPSSHWAHIGRIVGPKILEMLEQDVATILRPQPIQH